MLITELERGCSQELFNRLNEAFEGHLYQVSKDPFDRPGLLVVVGGTEKHVDFNLHDSDIEMLDHPLQFAVSFVDPILNNLGYGRKDRIPR